MAEQEKTSNEQEQDKEQADLEVQDEKADDVKGGLRHFHDADKAPDRSVRFK